MYNKVYGGKMRSLLILMAVLCVAITSMSCLPTKSTTPISQKDVDQDTAIAEVKRSVQSIDSAKASTNDFSTLKGRVDTMEVKVNAGGSSNSYDKTVLYTKSEVDTAITAAITKLKADTDQAWIKTGGGGTGGGGGTSPTGSVAFATTPVAIPQVYSASTGSGQSIFYTMKIVNSSPTWQYVKPIITMSVQSSYSARSVTGITITMSSGACSMTGSIATPAVATSSVGNFSVSPNAGAGATSTSSITIIPISGCNGTGEYQVGAGQSMDVLIQISGLTTSDVTLWNVTNSISTRGL